MPPAVMQHSVLIRLRPTGPWRYGPGDGAQDRVDAVFRSDRVFSAVTVAMQQLGILEEWLDATARASVPAVAFTSLYPYQGDTLFATPPASVWPPPASQLTAPNPAFLNKIRWNAVQMVPLTVIQTLLTGGSIPAEQWIAEPATGCLLRRDRPGSAPFRVTVRNAAAIDRVTRGAIQVSSSACVEFEPDAGLWTAARYRDSAAVGVWQDRLEACFRLLADSGFGGRRTHGWGKAESPVFKRGTWPGIILPKLGRASNAADESEPSLYWLLSLYSPAPADAIDWTGGDYQLIVRGGRVESLAASGSLKKNARMVAEGSVLAASQEPTGAALDVAPEHFAHPVYRSGFAIALKLPVGKAGSDYGPVEMPADQEARDTRPCDDLPVERIDEEAPESSASQMPEVSPIENVTSDTGLTDVEGEADESAGPPQSTETDEAARETEEGSPDEL